MNQDSVDKKEGKRKKNKTSHRRKLQDMRPMGVKVKGRIFLDPLW